MLDDACVVVEKQKYEADYQVWETANE